ncbi:hypothetical protein EA58_01490 [Photobacterium galatheae]|uniref:Uncharacterized protein n=1 Tax=Photobacterium galatheae TaxID=1654360 RepID=A0A066RW38_9GAMM|nr:hypothetical protein EA58_01490 [Photobacterium galatheae]
MRVFQQNTISIVIKGWIAVDDLGQDAERSDADHSANLSGPRDKWTEASYAKSGKPLISD